MIVVINPSGGAGQSFKGLHAYCSHDSDQAQTSERVDWVEGRNLAIDDPAQAWKIMAATAQAQNALKAAAGIKSGRVSKHGPVQHVVLSFDKDEPQSRSAMMDAADEYLANHGVDPAKMRAKNKPKRRQFADEHQVMIYAHNDGTSGRHLHLMINRVHPETGLNLPSNNDHLKAQKWALEYSKRHGTDHKTPARAENMADRDAGEYVLSNRRKSRNAYERDKAAEAVNDNDKAKTILALQAKKDAALGLRGRNMAKTHAVQREKLVTAHKTRKAALARSLQKQIIKAKAAIREEFRPQRRDLTAFQKAERKTFEALERSFFGRAGNTLKTLRLSAKDVRGGPSNVISRTFKIATNAADRKAYFEKAQKREIMALEHRQSDKLSDATKTLKATHSDDLARNRAVFADERSKLMTAHGIDQQKLKDAWKIRMAERENALNAIKAKATFTESASPTRQPTGGDDKKSSLVERYERRARSLEATRTKAAEQNNERNGGDRER